MFAGAFSWLTVTHAAEGEAAAWLTAMARDAVAQRRGSGWIAGPAGPRAPADDPVAAVASLGDPEREVVVLRLLLGHSLAHTAHLSGYRQRAVMQLQLAACLTVWELTGGARAGAAPAARTAASVEEFEHHRASASDRPPPTRPWPAPSPSPGPCARPPTAGSRDPPPPWSSACARTSSPGSPPVTSGHTSPTPSQTGAPGSGG